MLFPAVTYPEATFPSQHAEEQLQLLYRDAVTGQDSQHVDEQVFQKTDNKHNPKKKGWGPSVHVPAVSIHLITPQQPVKLRYGLRFAVRRLHNENKLNCSLNFV